MKKLTLIAAAALSLVACQHDSLADSSNNSFDMKSTSAEYLTASSLPVTTVNSNITTNTTWSGVIELDGNIAVKDGAKLTILPGTFIKAKPNADGEGRGVLIVTKTGSIDATGTESQPIIFTSYNLLDGNEDTTATAGDFGGVVLLGDAPTNVPTTTTVEGLTGADFQFGGTNSSHSAGIMKYVRIEFAGYDFAGANSGNEVNALTLAGVGSGTTIDHIQVSYGQDDSFEFFGGTVNATNLVSFAAEDDNFDFDNGYTGTITCALALADYNSGHTISGQVSDTNGIELDNNAGGTSTALITHPVINNLTIVGVKTDVLYTSPSPYTGSKYENGIHIRRNGRLTLNDAVITGYPTGIRVEGSGSELSSASTYSSIKVHGFTTAVTGLGTAGIPAANLVVSATADAFGMSNPFFNGGWNISPRNCGNFQGIWTKYDFSLVD